jgi:hypothetical protein
MMRRTFALFACMAVCWIGVPSHAAEISCDTPIGHEFATEQPAPKFPCNFHGHLSGESSKNGYEKDLKW